MKRLYYYAEMKYIITIISVIISIGSIAQEIDQVPNRLKVELGYHRISSQDLVYSPMIYSGGSLGMFSLGYEIHRSHGYHDILINVDGAKVRSTDVTGHGVGGSLERAPSEAAFYNFQYSYNRQIWGNGSTSLFLGPLVDSQLLFTLYKFGLGEDEGFMFAHSLSLKSVMVHAIDEKRSIRITASFPMVSFVARPSYAIVDNGDIQNAGSDIGYYHGQGSWEGPGGFVKFQLAGRYVKSISEKSDLVLGYQFRYMSYQDPIKISAVKNGFSVGFNFKF